MRKVIVVIVILIIGAGGATALFYAIRNNSATDNTPAVSGNGKDKTFRPDPSNATFTIDDENITLSAGRNERNIAPGSALVEETILLDQFAYGDINADGKEDAVFFLARYGGGSGTFIYLAAFVSGPVTYRGSKATFIGDRVSPQSISINNTAITVKYLDRAEDEPLAAEPTIQVSKQFFYRAGEFEER